MKKKIFILAGCLSLLFGVVGIFIPLLPTTPFLLLSAWLWLRSSDRLYAWLLHHKVLGSYIRDYTENKAIPVRVKIFTLVLLWGSILFCIFCVVSGRLWLQTMLLGIAVGVSWHVIGLRNRRGKQSGMDE